MDLVISNVIMDDDYGLLFAFPAVLQLRVVKWNCQLDIQTDLNLTVLYYKFR